MNKIGISSSCYYPQVTEESFRKVCESGADTAELFFNSYSELKESFVKELIKMKDAYGITVPSVHPFGSFTESFYLFSSYKRRFYDSLPLYERFFEVMNMLGSEIFVIHGSKLPGSVNDEQYFELFGELREIGKKYNIITAQENVVYYRSESPDLLCRMRDYLGSDFRIVFDVKQAYRAGVDVYDFLDKLGENVCHIHLSDRNGDKDCIPPGEGIFDFGKLFRHMNSINYNGAYIEELYSHSYSDETQIISGYKHLKEIYNKNIINKKALR